MTISTTYTDPVVVVGDFNLDTSQDANKDYSFLLQSFNFRNVITTPTRVTSVSSSIIDHALTNIDTDVHAGVFKEPIADHLSMFIVLNNLIQNKKEHRRHIIKTDYTMLRKSLLQISFDDIYDNDVNTEFSNLIGILKNAVNNCCRVLPARSYQLPICPWMNDDILQLLKTKNFWYNKWKCHKTNRYYLGQYKLLLNKCVTIIRARKKQYYSRCIQEASGDTRKIWGIINEVTGGRQSQRVCYS